MDPLGPFSRRPHQGAPTTRQVPRAVLLDVGDHIWYDYALEGADFPENGIVAASGFRFAGEEASPAA